MHRKVRSDMTEGKTLGKIILFALPLMLSGILQLLYNAADLVVVGQFASSTSMGAVGACSSLINLIVGACLGLSIGAGISASHDVGSGAHKRLSRLIHTSLLTGFLSGLLVGILGFLASRALLVMMKTPAEILPEAVLYMRAYFVGVPAAMVYNFLAAILRSSGDSKRPFIFLAVSGFINVILNLVMVLGFGLGAVGVGIATAASQYAAAIMAIVYMMRHKGICHIDLQACRIDKGELARIFRMGIPSGIQSMCFSLSNVVLQSSVNLFGDVAVEGNSAAANIAGFIYIVVYSFAQTATVFAGQNLGAGRLDRLNRILGECALCTAVSGLLVGMLSVVFAHPLLSLYAPGNEAAIAVGILHLKMVAPPYFIYGIMAVGAGMMQGMGRPVLPMVINLVGTCVLRLIWVAGLGLLVPGYEKDPSNIQLLYLCYPVSWSCTLVAQYIAYFSAKRKMERGLACTKA